MNVDLLLSGFLGAFIVSVIQFLITHYRSDNKRRCLCTIIIHDLERNKEVLNTDKDIFKTIKNALSLGYSADLWNDLTSEIVELLPDYLVESIVEYYNRLSEIYKHYYIYKEEIDQFKQDNIEVSREFLILNIKKIMDENENILMDYIAEENIIEGLEVTIKKLKKCRDRQRKLLEYFVLVCIGIISFYLGTSGIVIFLTVLFFYFMYNIDVRKSISIN